MGTQKSHLERTDEAILNLFDGGVLIVHVKPLCTEG